MNFKDFYSKEEGHMILLKDIEVSESLAYHLKNKLTLAENVFRIYSEEYFSLIKEARNLYNQDALALNDEDLELIESSLGEKAIFEGREVYLDAPITINEDLFNEGLSIMPSNSVDTQIFVDMDGVLCDLYKVVAEKMGKKSYKDLTQKEYAQFFAENANDMDKIFAELPKYESTDFLVKMLKEVAGGYKVCSANLKNHDSSKVIKGKNDWLDKKLSDQPDQRIFIREKYKYATTNNRPNILIDDWSENIKNWINAGGIGIHYCANEDDLDVVIEGLNIAREILKGEQTEGMFTEATKNGKKVKLNHPFRTPGGPKKFAVYVKTPKGTIKKVTFGDPNMKVRNANKARAKSFRARHKCSQKKDKTTAGYWSCNISRYRKALGLKSSRAW
jgi:hypothetical protein